MEANAATKQTGIIRPLGNLEAYHSMLHHLGYLFGVVVGGRYAIPGRIAVKSGLSGLRESFEIVVARTVLEHPLLRVGLVGEGSKQPSWVELQQVDLSWHIQWRDLESSHDIDSLYQNTLPTQLDSRFDDLETRPGWRLTVLHDSQSRQLEVIFAWNHANFDGISGRIFHERLLRNLNTLEQGAKLAALNNHILSLRTVGDTFPPPQEHTTKYTVTPGYLLSSAWKEMRPSFLSPKTTTHATWAPIRTSPFGTRVRGFSVNSDDNVQKLLDACREHRTTLTGLLNAIILVSLASQLDNKIAPAFAGGTALNMRRFSSPGQEFHPDSTMANFVSDVKHHFGTEETTGIRKVLERASPAYYGHEVVRAMVWRIATRVRGEIQAKLNTGTRDDIIGLMKFVGDWRKTITGQTRKLRSLSWNVSNIGVLEGNAYQSGGDRAGAVWKCDRAGFVLGGEVTGAAFNVGVISVRGKGLDVAVSWQACAVGSGIGEQLVANIESWLRELVKPLNSRDII